MAHRIELLAEATEEATQAREWYESRSPTAARRFGEELDQAMAAIAEAPNRWPEHLHGTRRYRLNRFPFLIVYQVAGDRVRVVAIQHTSRRPGYWRMRVGRR